MANIYEYGSTETQENPNYLYSCYMELNKMLGHKEAGQEGNGDLKAGAKATGAAVAEVFRQNIEYVIEKNGLAHLYKVSENNVYIAGCHIEFDFLILKKEARKHSIDLQADGARKIYFPIYALEDVVAVLESKTYGLYTLYQGREKDKAEQLRKNDLFRFVSSYDELHGRDRGIKAGYMCLAEQRPNKGSSNFMEKTVYFFEDYFGQKYDNPQKVWDVYFSKCHYANATPDLYATDAVWEDFVMGLLGHR